MEKNSLYESLQFEYNVIDSVDGVFGEVHQCHNEYTPIHKKYAISVKANVPDRLKDKVYIAKQEINNNFKYLGGIWKNGFLRTKVLLVIMSPEILTAMA